jgi:predicted aminopeptidase
LALVPRIKAFGERQGLAHTRSYESISLEWDRTIYNLSACSPVAFEPETWWFPIVGRVPYLGFFRPQDATRRADDLRAKGLDVWVRTAGAYSTLGWFRDPILPQMLEWSEAELAETLLHETAHATLWVKGSVKFNESFANIVGQWAGEAYMVEHYGEQSPEVQAMRKNRADIALWRQVLRNLYKDLDTTFTDSDLDDTEKLERKELALASLPHRVREIEFSDPERFERVSLNGPWNNARLLQFRTYNAHRDAFVAVLTACNDEIDCFIRTIREITQGRRDPYVALYAHLQWDFLDDVQ